MQLDRVLDNLDFKRLRPNERKRYINRINTIAVVIEQRFPHVVNSQQIKLHHAQYFRNVWLANHSSSKRTRQEFMRALGLLVKAMGHDEKWLGALGITQPKAKGGRPTMVGVKSQKP
ncbi:MULTISPECIES: hypothetical protein [unclassified Marinobacter]|jgi:hypothetical protein|uniref:hypothetical protein n=1 Tax=unclassified Marinobacter TaxID=83889 RepID=UPI000C654E40|nr:MULTISPECIES: hypothetical protein [unclassified Marinobacter]MAB52966.1 hypothetical protein [Marinobacter sp.]MBN14026.1 hypothetical protein [Pelagibacterium sp.]|tara:strand:+ start:158 stop:508 length:351 start_codon:yes stop_codon:yes gene_type:complete